MTTNIFNQIAPGWYNFRHWSIFRNELEALAHRWQKGKLLNLGCAHGPDFLPFIHHIKGKEKKRAALNELRRVLKPGGEAFITVWNHWQPRFWFKGKEVAVPWRKKDKTLYRYYYLFSYAELERLVKQAGFEVLKSSPESSYHFPLKFFSRNICLLVRKGD